MREIRHGTRWQEEGGCLIESITRLLGGSHELNFSGCALAVSVALKHPSDTSARHLCIAYTDVGSPVQTRTDPNLADSHGL